MKTKQTIVKLISSAFMLLFMYTAISKIIDYTHFVSVIQTSPLLKNVGYFVGAAVPVSEVIAFILLAHQEWRLKGLWLSAVLMIVFTGYIVAILATNKYVPCNCGGVIEKMTWRQHLFFNIFFDILAILGIIFQKQLAQTKQAYRNNSAILG